MAQKQKEHGYVKCPFFKWYKEKEIGCEGVQKNSNIRLTFDKNATRMEYMHRNCFFCCSSCIIAKALRDKYINKF